MARVLIADDSIMMRKTLREILTKSGHTVVAEAADGVEACREFDLHQPDLVTLDIYMPIMSGMDALREILSRHPHARIIIVSSEGGSSMICQALKSGAKSYVIKPFFIHSLVDTVNKILQYDSTVQRDTIYNV